MKCKFARLFAMGIVLATVIIAGALPGFSADDIETFDAVANGTSAQMGKNISIKVRIYQYSTAEDRQVLMDAFLKGGNDGLNKALSKMKPVGRISLPGTTGYDIAYAIQIPTPTGRKIRFVTDRKIAFGEAYRSSTSKSFNLTAGEFTLDQQDKDKSTGVLLPAAQLIINEDGEPPVGIGQESLEVDQHYRLEQERGELVASGLRRALTRAGSRVALLHFV